MSDYDDILHLPRPFSKRPKMSPEDRAKIFAPFAALKGYEESVHEREERYEPRKILSEDAQLDLDRRLAMVEKRMMVTVLFFVPTKRAEDMEWGQYREITGLVSEVDPVFHTLTVVRRRIPMEDICAIRGEGIPEGEFENEEK